MSAARVRGACVCVCGGGGGGGRARGTGPRGARPGAGMDEYLDVCGRGEPEAAKRCYVLRVTLGEIRGWDAAAVAGGRAWLAYTLFGLTVRTESGLGDVGGGGAVSGALADDCFRLRASPAALAALASDAALASLPVALCSPGVLHAGARLPLGSLLAAAAGGGARSGATAVAGAYPLEPAAGVARFGALHARVSMEEVDPSPGTLAAPAVEPVPPSGGGPGGAPPRSAAAASSARTRAGWAYAEGAGPRRFAVSVDVRAVRGLTTAACVFASFSHPVLGRKYPGVCPAPGAPPPSPSRLPHLG